MPFRANRDISNSVVDSNGGRRDRIWINIASGVDEANDPPPGTQDAVPNCEALPAVLFENFDACKWTRGRLCQLRRPIYDSVYYHDDFVVVR